VEKATTVAETVLKVAGNLKLSASCVNLNVSVDEEDRRGVPAKLQQILQIQQW
jgi:hypothetical protein